MPKLTLKDPGANFRSVQQIKSNNDAIEAAVEKTLSRDGTAPNQMEAVLDMNSNRIINLPAPAADTDPIRRVDVDSGIGADITVVAGIATDVTTVAGDSADIQAVAADLNGSDTIGAAASLVAAGTPGFISVASPGVANVRTLTAGSGIAISNPTGAAGNPQITLDAELVDIANITPGDGVFIVGDGSDFVGESGDTALTSLGAGTVGLQLFKDNTAADARNELGLGTAQSPTFGGLTVSGVAVSPTGAAVGQALGFPNSTTTLEPYTPAGAGDVLAAANTTFSGINVGGNATSLAALKARSVSGLTNGQQIAVFNGQQFRTAVWRSGSQTRRVAATPLSVTAINTSDDELTFGANHNLFSGQAIRAEQTANGLTAGQRYYVQRISNTVIRLHSTIKSVWDDDSRVDITGTLTTLQVALLADPQEGVWIAPNSDPTGASGVWECLPGANGTVNVLDFGAFGNYSISNNTGTADDNAFHGAIQWLAYADNVIQKRVGGRLQIPRKQFLTLVPIHIYAKGIRLEGTSFPDRIDFTVATINESAIYCNNPSFPALLIAEDDFHATDLSFDATINRTGAADKSVRPVNNSSNRNAIIDNVRFAQRSNGGILIERPDDVNTSLTRIQLEHIKSRDHPGDGFLVSGLCANIQFLSCSAIRVNGHGFAVDGGVLNNRTTKLQAGIVQHVLCRSVDTKGHLYVAGHPWEDSPTYRTDYIQCEGFRVHDDPANPIVTYDKSNWFLRGQQVACEKCAFSGNGPVTDDKSRWNLKIGGDSPLIDCCRVIDGGADGIHILVATCGSDSARTMNNLRGVDGGTIRPRTESVRILGVQAAGGPGTANLVTVENTVHGVRLQMPSGAYAQPLSLGTDVKSVMVDDMTVTQTLKMLGYDDVEIENVSITSGNITGLTGTMAPFATLTGDERIEINTLTGSTQVNGMFRLVQNTGATGDASFRVQVGTDNWIFGQRRSNNTFCIRNSTSFSNTGNIVNIASDGGTNGNVGIGPNTTVPAYRVDVDGSINVRTGGAFRFAGTQVVGARVINANIADPAAITAQTLTDNSGGSASTTIAAIGAAYDQAEVRNAVASLAAQMNNLKADVDELRAKLVAANTTIRTHGLGAAS
jgi:hypothetical protein